jgi:hypothetical protein
VRLEELDAMCHKLYQDPDLAVPIKDALEDLGIAWLEWLDRNRVIRRLAESCVYAQRTILTSPSEARSQLTKTFCNWRKKVKAYFNDPAGTYTRLCAAYGVRAIYVNARWRHEPEDVQTTLRPMNCVSTLQSVFRLVLKSPLQVPADDDMHKAVWNSNYSHVAVSLYPFREYRHHSYAFSGSPISYVMAEFTRQKMREEGIARLAFPPKEIP